MIVMLNGSPAVCVPMLVKSKWSRAPGLTVNELLVPNFEEPDVPIVMSEPDAEIETELLQTPAANAEVAVGVIVPEETDRVLAPV